MDTFHLGALGTLLLAGSAILLAKAFFWPSFLRESARAFFGSNPFQVRNSIVQRDEAVAGILWLALGVVVSLLGISTNGEPLYLIGRTWDVLLVIFIVCIAGFLTFVMTRTVSRRQYLPYMIEMQKEGFEQARTYLANEGRSGEEVERALTLDAETQRHRLAQARGFLDQIGQLIDVPRTAEQDDHAYLNVLRPFFDNNTSPTPARTRPKGDLAIWVQAIGTIVLIGITGWYAWLTYGLLQVQVEPDVELEIGLFPSPHVFIRNDGKYPIVDISMEADNYVFLGPPRNQLMTEMRRFPSATPLTPWWHVKRLDEREVQTHPFDDVADNVIGQIQQWRTVQKQGRLVGIKPEEQIQFLPAIIFRMKYHREVDQRVFRKEKAIMLMVDTTVTDNGKPKWFPMDAESTRALQYKEIIEELTKAMRSHH